MGQATTDRILEFYLAELAKAGRSLEPAQYDILRSVLNILFLGEPVDSNKW